MTIKKITTIAAALAMAALPAAAQQTKLLTADKHNEYGLVYSLPQTVFDVEVAVRHDVSQAGPYWQYAKKFVGTDKVVKEDKEVWTITDIRLTPRGIADPEQQYLMQLKPGSTTYICVGEDGMLCAINTEKDLPPASVALRPSAPLQMPSQTEYLEYVNEDFLTSQSSAKQAQLLSESLMEIRDSRLSLSRGTAETMPVDGRQLELMLQSLAAQDAAIMRAFTGASGSETIVRRFTYKPQEGTMTLFRMSDFAGIVDADDLAGSPVQVTLEVTREAKLPVDANGVEKKLPKDAVIYALPATASISISRDGKELWSGDSEVAQFGTIFGLSPALFTDKKAPSFATFNPATGALMELGEMQK